MGIIAYKVFKFVVINFACEWGKEYGEVYCYYCCSESVSCNFIRFVLFSFCFYFFFFDNSAVTVAVGEKWLFTLYFFYAFLYKYALQLTFWLFINDCLMRSVSIEVSCDFLCVSLLSPFLSTVYRVSKK
jgi:hypothetical protein